MRLRLSLALVIALASGAPALAAGCEDLSFPVYFAKGGAAVTGPAEQVLTEAAARLAGCRVRAIVLTPQTAASEPDGAEDLARARADAVARALTAAGVDSRLIHSDTDASAEPGALLPPRVTVEVRVRPEAPQAGPSTGVALV